MTAHGKHHFRSKRIGTRLPLHWLLGAALACATSSVAAEGSYPSRVTVTEITDLAVAVDAAKKARSETAQGRILLVLDIDNTLLTMPQYLGGDRWFNHHSLRITGRADTDFTTIDELIAAQAALFGLASMDVTQPGIPALLDDAGRAGIDVFLISARGPDLYDATRRELDRNRLKFVSPYACAFFLCTSDGVYRDREIRAALVAIGEDAPAAPYRNVLIRDGLMLVSGQDKGVMLKLLMGAISGRGYAHVVVADDGRKNIDAFAASRNPLPLSLFHYRRIDTQVTEAEDRRAQKQLRELRAALCPALQTTFCPKQAPLVPGAGK